MMMKSLSITRAFLPPGQTNHILEKKENLERITASPRSRLVRPIVRLRFTTVPVNSSGECNI